MTPPPRLLRRRLGGPHGICPRRAARSSSASSSPSGALSCVAEERPSESSPKSPTTSVPEEEEAPTIRRRSVDDDDDDAAPPPPTPPESEKEKEKDDAASRFRENCQAMGVSDEVAERVERESEMFGKKWWKSFQGVDDDGNDDEKKEGKDRPSAAAPGGDFADPSGRAAAADDDDPAAEDDGVPPVPAAAAADGESISNLLRSAKSEVLKSLSAARGDTTSSRFLSSVNALSSVYRGSGGGGVVVVVPSSSEEGGKKSTMGELFEGSWHTLSKPNFKECLGRNARGDYLYTLGRMSFDMFRPTGLRCSVRKILCTSRRVGSEESSPNEVPRSLRDDVRASLGGDGILRTYDIEVHFTIEPRSSADDGNDERDAGYRAPTKPIKAVMTNHGYALPDPNDRGRFTVWFARGIVAPVPDDETKSKSASKIDPFWTGRDDSAAGNDGNGNVCTLGLDECRRTNKSCSLHGLKCPSRDERRSLRRSAARYARPRYGAGSRAPPSSALLPHPSKLGTMANPYSVEWEDIFAPADNWKRSLGDRAKALAAKVMLGAEVPTGMDDDGTMSFVLNRPIGGHGVTYVDILYLDEDMRIIRGNAGSIFVQVRDESRLHRLSTRKTSKSHSAAVVAKETKKNSSSSSSLSQRDAAREARRQARKNARRSGGKALAA